MIGVHKIIVLKKQSSNNYSVLHTWQDQGEVSEIVKQWFNRIAEVIAMNVLGEAQIEMEQKGQISENSSIRNVRHYYPDTNSGSGQNHKLLMPEAI